MKYGKAQDVSVELVEVVGTGKSKYLPKDSTHTVGKEMADDLVESGKATIVQAKEETPATEQPTQQASEPTTEKVETANTDVVTTEKVQEAPITAKVQRADAGRVTATKTAPKKAAPKKSR